VARSCFRLTLDDLAREALIPAVSAGLDGGWCELGSLFSLGVAPPLFPQWRGFPRNNREGWASYSSLCEDI